MNYFNYYCYHSYKIIAFYLEIFNFELQIKIHKKQKKMIHCDQQNIPSVTVRHCQNINLPISNRKIQQFSTSVSLFECENIEELVKNMEEKCFLFTTGKTFAWRVQVEKVQNNLPIARSKRLDEFVLHTDHSFSKNPPQFFALYCEREDKCQGGKSKLVSLDQILYFLSNQQIQDLTKIKFPFKVPAQFIQFNSHQTLNYLPLLYKQDGEILIRWREQIIQTSLLDGQQLQLLKSLSSAIKKVKPFEFSLHQTQCIVINNGKFLHARTEIKDPNRLLYRIMFDIDPNIRGQIKTDAPFDNQNYATELKKYMDRFSQQVNQKNCLSIPEDFFSLQTLRLDSSFQKIQKLKTSLNSFYKTIVKLYSSQNSIGSQLRQLLNWPEEINSLIGEMNEKLPYDIGFYRPDIIFQEKQKNIYSPKICEVNIRYALNGFIISLLLQKLSLPSQCQKNEPKLIQQIVLNKFKNQKLIHFVTNSEKIWDPLLLQSMVKPLGVQMKWIRTQNIHCRKVQDKIECIYDQQGIQIRCIILQLKQEELIEMSKLQIQKLRYLVFNTISLNDLRSIFISHDKRLLTLFNKNLPIYKDLQMNYLFHAEMSILNEYSIQSYIISQSMLADKSITECKEKWTIKAPHKGKGVDMIFGCEVSEQQWIQSVKQKSGWILQKIIQPLKIPIICPLNQQKDMVKSYNTVCTFLCYNNQFLGIGLTRASDNKKVSLACNGVALATFINKEKMVQQKYNFYDRINKIKIYSPCEIKKLCEQRYQKEITKMTKKQLTKYNQDESVGQKWNSCYISPSGGSSFKFCYVGTEIDQNRFLRKIFAQELEQNKLMSKNDICIVLHTSMIAYRSRQILVQFCELVGATAIPLDLQLSNETVLEFMNMFNPNMFSTTPSRLISFAKFSQKSQLCFPNVKNIMYSGQMLYDNQRNLVKKIFPFAQFSSIFGSAQIGVLAYTRKGFQDNLIFSYLNQFYQLQIEQPDQFGIGKLLVTSLVRTKTPVYRYQLGDYAKLINSNTFQLIPRPTVLRFRMIYMDFRIQQFHQLLNTAQKWQVVLQNLPQPKMTFKIKVQKPETDQFQLLKDKVQKYLFMRFMQDNGVNSQFNYQSLTTDFQKVIQDKWFIKSIPSNKHYYIVDKRLK